MMFEMFVSSSYFFSVPFHFITHWSFGIPLIVCFLKNKLLSPIFVNVHNHKKHGLPLKKHSTPELIGNGPCIRSKTFPLGHPVFSVCR